VIFYCCFPQFDDKRSNLLQCERIFITSSKANQHDKSHKNWTTVSLAKYNDQLSSSLITACQSLICHKLHFQNDKGPLSQVHSGKFFLNVCNIMISSPNSILSYTYMYSWYLQDTCIREQSTKWRMPFSKLMTTSVLKPNFYHANPKIF
jgi:hypothetical protein